MLKANGKGLIRGLVRCRVGVAYELGPAAHTKPLNWLPAMVVALRSGAGKWAPLAPSPCARIGARQRCGTASSVGRHRGEGPPSLATFRRKLTQFGVHLPAETQKYRRRRPAVNPERY